MDTNLSGINYQPYSEALNKLGFCTFPVFDDFEIEKLHSLYQSNFGERKINQLYASHNSNPVEQSLAINREIKQIVNPRLQEIFPDFEYFIGHYMVKGALVNKEFALHQDWNIVEESKYKSYQIWIPLQLTYPNNGGIFVVPGSHLFFSNYRSGSYGVPVIPFNEKLKPLVTDIIVPPGNVLVYHNALFHASHPNATDEIRIAVIVNLVEKGAPICYFHKNAERDSTELYSVNGEVFISHLPELEKGIVHQSIALSGNTDLCTIQNDTIHSEDLIIHYRNRIGNTDAAQIKQLHITTNADCENELNEMGYLIIDLLDPDGVKSFKKEYLAHFGNLDRTPGRFTTLQDTDPTIKKQMHDFIVKNVNAPLKNYFKDFIIPVSQFYTKKAFTSGDIDLHADSTLLINHQLEPHYAIWVPLIDVNENNGTLMVIPRSHKVNRAFFSSSLGGYHNQHLEWLRQYEIPIILKAGQAVVFDNNLLHNSTANTTAVDRLCFTFRMTHFASRYYSFFCGEPAEDSFEISEEEHDYYMADNWDGNSNHPTGSQKGTYKNGRTKVTTQDLQKILNPSDN